jgi:hypothetical protein
MIMRPVLIVVGLAVLLYLILTGSVLGLAFFVITFAVYASLAISRRRNSTTNTEENHGNPR